MSAPRSGPEFLLSGVLAVPHGFFTRRGGVSTGPFASLNCNASSADSSANIVENRARVATALSIRPDLLLGLKQVHGTEVVRVKTPWRFGEGVSADAMVTDQPGLGLGIVTADCAPVLLADREAGVVGAAHAGWRGALAGVLEATLAAMLSLGARTERIVAAAGPCIAQASYEVGSELREAVTANDPAAASMFQRGREGHWHFALAGYCGVRLRSAGITLFSALEADTAADEARFFSHRRRVLSGGGPLGHQISVITLPTPAA